MELKLTRLDWLSFLKRNLADPQTRKLPLGRLLKGWLRGFDSEHILLFDLDDSNWRNYLPDLHRYRFTHRTNFHVWPILHDKLLFDQFMRGRLPVIGLLFWINEGVFNDAGAGWTQERFFDECRRGGRFVLKAGQGGTGLGLLFVTGREDGGAVVNGEVKDEQAFRRLLGSLPYHLCYPHIEAHPALKAVFPDAGNALRITAYVGVDGRPRLLAPSLCLGTAKSAPVEHFRYGGLVLHVDEQTGVCLKACRRGADGRLEYLDKHPDTGASLAGLQVPFWKEIREGILRFHTDHPAFDLVGWDVMATSDGFRIVEGNHNPALRIALMNRNLSEEPDFCAFLESRGILNAGRERRAGK